MSQDELPKILVVDDEEDRSLEVALGKRVQVKTMVPQVVEEEDLDWADLLLIDFKLDHWSERNEQSSLSLSPPDGVALAAIYRRHLAKTEKPTTIALHTGNLEELAGDLPPENRLHILASLNNLEWVFRKSDPVRLDQIASLAQAIITLPTDWVDVESSPEKLVQLLGLEFRSTERLLLDDVFSCMPPLFDLSSWSHGVAVLRWLLHRILPYPTMLLDQNHLAARLGVEASVLNGEHLREELKNCEYTGILANFDGARWWKASVERKLWDANEGNFVSDELLASIVSKWAKHDVIKAAAPNPVVTVDQNFTSTAHIRKMEECVRIRPDDWPAFAEPAWISKELVRSDNKMLSLVIREDRDLLTND